MVTANMSDMTVVLGNGDTLLELATYLESNTEIGSGAAAPAKNATNRPRTLQTAVHCSCKPVFKPS